MSFEYLERPSIPPRMIQNAAGKVAEFGSNFQEFEQNAPQILKMYFECT